MTPALLIITTLIGLICSALGVTVIFQDRNKWSNRFFFTASQFASLWIFANTIFPVSSDEIAEFAGRVSFTSALLLVLSLWLFAASFPTLKVIDGIISVPRIISWIILIPALTVLTWTDLLVAGIIRDSQGNPSIQYGQLYQLFSLLIVVSMIFIGIELYRKLKIFKSQDKLQITYFFLGFVITGVLTLFTNLVIPVLTGSSFYSRYGPLSMIFFLGLANYAIVRHKLFGISFILSKISVYALVATVPYIGFYVVLGLQNSIWGSPYALGAYFLGIFIAIGFSYLFLISKDWVDNRLLKNILPKGLDSASIIENFVQEVEQELDVTKLGDYTYKVINTSFDPNRSIFLLVKSKDNSKVYFSDNGTNGIGEAEVMEVLEKLKTNNLHQPILTSELDLPGDEEKPIIDKFTKLGIELIVFFGHKDTLITGVLLLGSRKNNNAYTLEDIEFIETINSNITVAFARSMLYEEVQMFNKTLQDKVDQATHELQDKNAELLDTLKKERERLDILGHELRTPAGTTRNAISMLIKSLKDIGVTDPKVDKYTDMGLENIRRLIRIVETVLSESKIVNGQMTLDLKPIDVKDVVNDSYEAFNEMATKKGITLSIELEPDAGLIAYADRDRTQEVLDNFVSNAIKYTSQGSIKIKAGSDTNWVNISVIDTGKGISESDMSKLGTRFYRIGNILESSSQKDYQIVRPDGTGLGLYVAFKLIEMMNGKRTVESQIGQGSNFTFSLPKYTNQPPTKLGDSVGQDRVNQMVAEKAAS